MTLSVTTTAAEAVAAANATDAITNGFKMATSPAPQLRLRPGRRHRAACVARRRAAPLKVGPHALRGGGLSVCRRRHRRSSAVWTLSRPRSADIVRQVLRAVAPTQLAAAAMLAVAGVVALSSQPETACWW